MRWILSFIFLSFASFASEPFEVVEDLSKLSIETPALRNREIRKLRLSNGLETLLISDPTTPHSGAALAVGVGSWDDPQDRPGMAHFVEHMLFLGTEKYPEEAGYCRYLDEHGGMRNAYTMSDRTVYMFSVNNDGFEGALDRFGQFFIAPLFNPSGVDRESQAIHQEYCKNVPNDAWRLLHVKKALANPDHPFHRFTMGNQETLLKISQDELKAWYRSHYSADLMHLVIYSDQNLDTLESQVLEIFSEVKRVETECNAPDAPLFKQENVAQLITLTPIHDLQVLEMSWEIPKLLGSNKNIHADRLVSHALGHEGATSLLAQLKKEGLAEGLSAGSSHAGRNQHVFTLSINLTRKGVQNYETVAMRVYESIAGLKRDGIPRYLYDEVEHTEIENYRFQSRGDLFEFVSDYARAMCDEPLETFPRCTLIPSDYAPNTIAQFIEALQPEKGQLSLIVRPELSPLSHTLQERWLGAEYQVKPLSQKILQTWAQATPHRDICVSRPNPFISDNLSVQDKGEDSSQFPHPQLIEDHPSGRIYAAKDEKFLIPEIAWTFRIHTPLVQPDDASTQVLADLYSLAVKEKLNATAYEASLAGLNYSLVSTPDGFELKLSGYQPKASRFLATILDAMQSTHPSRDQFTLFQNQLLRSYQNSVLESPFRQGREELASLLYKNHPTFDEKMRALSKLKYKQTTNFCSSLFNRSYVEGTLFGNGETSNIWQLIETNFASTPYPPEEHPKRAVATLPSSETSTFASIESPHPANALILTADCGAFTFKKRAAQEILTKGLEEPFFSELRTKQQTGYLVGNWSQEMERHLYSFFAVQSSSHDTRDLLARFELFLENSLARLEDEVIPFERFEAIRASLLHKLEHPAENLAAMGSVLHNLACEYNGDFKWLEKRKGALQALTYDEFVAYAHEFLSKSNTKRLALCVNGALPTLGRLSYKELPPKKLREQISYKTK